jgi:hypothetical protein
MKPEEINQLLSKTRDQKFRKHTQGKLDGFSKTQANWDARSSEERNSLGQKISNSKLTISQEQADEIWLKLWGPDRGADLYKKLAKDYNVADNAVSGLAQGSHPLCPVDKDQWQKIYEHWHKTYGYNKDIYIVRSPGNDLLDFYDSQNLLRGNGKVSKLSPSEIFDIRFRWLDKSDRAIRAYCNSKGISVDGAMFKTYANKTFGWLVDQPHEEWQFDSLVELSEWICTRTNRNYNGGGQIAHGYMNKQIIWMDKGFGLAGWTFIKSSK